EALAIGTALSIGGVTYLAFICNALSAALAAITIIVYIFAYTPLKLVSNFNTALGAVPGALPPMIGWAAARRSEEHTSELQSLRLFPYTTLFRSRSARHRDCFIDRWSDLSGVHL